MVSRACNERLDQRWELDSDGVMKSKGSPLMCFDIAPLTCYDVALVDQCRDRNACSASYDDQAWEFESNAGLVLVKNVYTGLCLTLNSDSDGADIIQSTCDRSPGSEDWWERQIIYTG